MGVSSAIGGVDSNVVMGLGRPEMVQALTDSAGKSWLKEISMTAR
jgi:hypothetical protein